MATFDASAVSNWKFTSGMRWDVMLAAFMFKLNL